MMRILIGYDGTDASALAVEGLQRAGLPGKVEAIVASVAEAWDHPPDTALARARADEAAATVQEMFRGWKVTTRIATGSAAGEIMAIAEACEPHLIVLGEGIRSGTGGSHFLGQTAQKLLSDADCSVRIGRAGASSQSDSLRLVVGFDGSAAAIGTIDTIVERSWPGQTQLRLVAVADSAMLQNIGRFTPQMKDAIVEERMVLQWARSLAASSINRLTDVGIDAKVVVRFGNPRSVLADEARSWSADTIFVGPHNSPNSFARFLIGSVSAAVAARASCSVEVVRRAFSGKVSKRTTLP